MAFPRICCLDRTSSAEDLADDPDVARPLRYRKTPFTGSLARAHRDRNTYGATDIIDPHAE
jgi:hypothetical protein